MQYTWQLFTWNILIHFKVILITLYTHNIYVSFQLIIEFLNVKVFIGKCSKILFSRIPSAIAAHKSIYINYQISSATRAHFFAVLVHIRRWLGARALIDWICNSIGRVISRLPYIIVVVSNCDERLSAVCLDIRGPASLFRLRCGFGEMISS